MYEAHKWLSNVVSVHKNAADLMKKRKMDNRWKEETHTQKNTWIKNANSEKKRIQIHSSSVFNFQINNTNKFRFYCQRSRVESEHSNKYSLKLNNETHEMKSFLQQKLHSKWESEKRMKETERKKNDRERIQRKHRCSPRCPTASYFVFYLLCFFSSLIFYVSPNRMLSQFFQLFKTAELDRFVFLHFAIICFKHRALWQTAWFFFLVQQKLSLFFFCFMKLLTSDDTQLVMIPIINFY